MSHRISLMSDHASSLTAQQLAEATQRRTEVQLASSTPLAINGSVRKSPITGVTQETTP